MRPSTFLRISLNLKVMLSSQKIGYWSHRKDFGIFFFALASSDFFIGQSLIALSCEMSLVFVVYVISILAKLYMAQLPLVFCLSLIWSLFKSWTPNVAGVFHFQIYIWYIKCYIYDKVANLLNIRIELNLTLWVTQPPQSCDYKIYDTNIVSIFFVYF